MYVVALLAVVVGQAAAKTDGFTKANAPYMYEDPPKLLRFLWIAGVVCAALAVLISVYNIRRQIAAAKAQGFGEDELITSYGARANRVITLLIMPLTFAVTAALQMFIPGGAELLALLRTVQLAFAMNVIIELLFILSGSQKQIVAQLPQEPIPVFGKPPLCCIFGWSRCAQQVKLWHLKLFVMGLQQFMVILPIIGIIDAYNQPYVESGGLSAKVDKACGIITTLSTLFGMWSFKCVLPLMTETISSRTVDPKSLSAMEHFVVLQMLFSRLLEKALPLLIKSDLEGESWVMPNALFLQIVLGFILCVVQLGLALLGLQGYSNIESMYPPVNFGAQLPPDTMAVLDMGGIDPDKWTLLRELADRSALGSAIGSALGSAIDSAPAAPLLTQKPKQMEAAYTSEESTTDVPGA